MNRKATAMGIFARTDSSDAAFRRALEAGDLYVVRVNTGRLDVERHTDFLNHVWKTFGFKVAHVIEQNGNTVEFFERAR